LLLIDNFPLFDILECSWKFERMKRQLFLPLIRILLTILIIFLKLKIIKITQLILLGINYEISNCVRTE